MVFLYLDEFPWSWTVKLMSISTKDACLYWFHKFTSVNSRIYGDSALEDEADQNFG